MTMTKQNWFRRSLSLLLSLMMCLSVVSVTVFAEESSRTMSGRYSVPIKSLTSAAPLPAVQTAFAGAFGDYVTVIVNADGSKTAVIRNMHIIIDLMGNKYDANVSSIVDADMSLDGTQAATVISTKQEKFTSGFGSTEQKDITVPDEFTIPLNLDANNAQQISITVDFMDAFLGGGNPYPTTVTLTLDMDAAVIDVSELETLIKECETISGDNYTEDSFAALRDTILKAKNVAANPETIETLNTMIAELAAVRDCLTYKGADYSAVDAAISKIPSDSTIYTEESWAAVEAAKTSIVNGLAITEQETVNELASALEATIAALVLKDADYSLVDQAIASVPADMLKYTDASVKKVDDAVAAVERGLKADRQTEVNAMASAITQAVAELEEKNLNKPNTETPNDEKLDVANLKDGTYEIPVALWHATQDKASMAASSFNGTARIVVKDGEMTVYVYTKPMSFGAITASLQEMKIEQSDGAWINAAIETKSSDGNPTCFSFTLDNLSQYVTVKVNPHVEMMGNQDLDARLKFDLNAIKQTSTETAQKPIEPPADTESNTHSGSAQNSNNMHSPQTGDTSNPVLWVTLMLVSMSALAVLAFNRKRKSSPIR